MSLMWKSLEQSTFKFYFCFWFGLFIYFLLGLGKRCRNWEKSVVDFYWITFKFFYIFK